MIVVEGMDNTGKTTLISKLAEELKLLSITNRRRPQRREDVFHYTANMTMLSLHFSTIFDRWQAISEPIYGPICRGIGFLEDGDTDYLHAVTRVANPLIIYCRPQDSTILNFGERDQMEGVIDNGRELITAYDLEMETVAKWFPVIRYDFERDTYDSIRDQALSHLKGPIQ